MTENNEEVVAAPEGGEGEVVVADSPLTSEQIAELKARAEKADKLESEVGSLKRDLKKVKKALEPEETPEGSRQSNEPDYSKIAFLNSIDVRHPDDQKVVIDEANRLKLPLTDVANMEHIKAKLSENLSKRDTQDGMPGKSGRTGGSATKDVQYYLDNPEESPGDPDLHIKVIDARMKRMEDGNKWGPTRFIG